MRGSPVFVPILRCLPSRVAFLGAMRDFLLSRALLPLIPPTPFSHKGRRGLLGILMAETKDGTQGPKKPTPVRDAARTPTTGHTLGARASRLRGAAGGTLPALLRRGIPLHTVRMTAHPGGAATLTVPESKEHSRTTMHRPGRNAACRSRFGIGGRVTGSHRWLPAVGDRVTRSHQSPRAVSGR